MYIYILVCVQYRVREGGRRRSGGLWRNEGVQGQTEGTGLFSQPADEELIQGEISSRLRGKNKKKKKKSV